MYGHVCTAMYVWICMHGFVWPCMDDYVCIYVRLCMHDLAYVLCMHGYVWFCVYSIYQFHLQKQIQFALTKTTVQSENFP